MGPTGLERTDRSRRFGPIDLGISLWVQQGRSEEMFQGRFATTLLDGNTRGLQSLFPFLDLEFDPPSLFKFIKRHSMNRVPVEIDVFMTVGLNKTVIAFLK